MNFKSLLSASAVAAALAFTGVAHAQSRTTPKAAPAPAQSNDWGLYGGLSIGDSDLDTTFKLFVGQPINRNVGWEAAYINFGEKKESAFGVDASASAWGIGGAVVGYLPFAPQWTGFGKLGAYYIRGEAKVNAPGFFSTTASESSVELGVGLGIRFQFDRQFSLRAELENYGGDGGDVISVGLQYRF